MRVLITLDGSALSERALAVMAPWAKAWRAEVLLLTVLDAEAVRATIDLAGHQPVMPMGLDTAQALTSIPEPSLVMVEDRNQAFVSARTTAEEEMQELAARYLPDSAVSVHAEFGEDPAKTISKFAREHMADFVALSSHGRSGVSQALMGSTATALVRESQLPVIVIGKDAVLPAG